MKIMVFCEDNSSFEFTSVMVYPYTEHNASDDCKYQIRVSHGTAFANSRQDYAIFKHGNKAVRDVFHKALNLDVTNALSKMNNTLGAISAVAVINLPKIADVVMSQNKESKP